MRAIAHGLRVETRFVRSEMSIEIIHLHAVEEWSHVHNSIIPLRLQRHEDRKYHDPVPTINLPTTRRTNRKGVLGV